MDSRSEVAPDTVRIELAAEGIEVEYTDGRRVFYHGVPEPAAGTVTTAPGKDVHVLVTDASETQGVLTYVNEQTTEDEILADAGVGRVLVDAGEEASIYPGVTVRASDLRVTVEADLDRLDGRVFVFEEDAMGECSYELVAETDGDEETA